MPRLFDMHVHFRDQPGVNCGNAENIKEDLRSGAEAAAAGGYGGVLCMPNTQPPLDTAERVADVVRRAEAVFRDTGVRIYVCGAVTVGQCGEVLTDFAALKRAGAVAVSDDGRPVPTRELMREAAVRAAENALVLISHAEDLVIVGGGIINKGEVSEKLGVEGIDRLSENASTRREVEIAEETGCPLHIAHVSTSQAVDIIRAAKRRGVPVTAETAPHYFALTENLLLTRDADYRMNPPLRTEADRRAVIEGLRDGTLDCIATDHAPHTPADKADFLTAPNGVVGLETALAAAVTVLYHEEHFSAEKIIDLMCVNPRKILKLPHEGVSELPQADLQAEVEIDTMAEWTVDPANFKSRSRNSAFKGTTLKGRIIKR